MHGTVDGAFSKTNIVMVEFETINRNVLITLIKQNKTKKLKKAIIL